MTKIETKIFEKLKDLIFSNQKIDDEILKKIGVDPTKKIQEFKNIRITNDFWSGLNIQLIDELKDVNGDLIEENKKLVSRVKNLYANGIFKIANTDLAELGLWNPSKIIHLGNLRLKNQSDFLFNYDYYDIDLVDKNKNVDGLWNDNVITTDRILSALSSFNISQEDLDNMKETSLTSQLEKHLKGFFTTVKKESSSNQGRIDLILGSNQNYGIEVKLAREISKAANCQKAIGQIELYSKQFNGNLMVLIAGKKIEKNDKNVTEVIRKSKECSCPNYFIVVD
jgi:hypothetical protein